MRLIRTDKVYEKRKRQLRVRKRNRTLRISTALVAGLFISLLFINALRPLPSAALTLDTAKLARQAERVNLAWPTTGQAAIRATGYGLLGTNGPNTPVATASIAKVITALCVLEKHPLELGEQGPTITFSRGDAALYKYQLEQNGSNIPVYEGSQMTEYEALEAMLIPSANNIADSLAIWSFGSLDAYASYANDFVLRNELVKTHVGSDASGLDVSTTSTAEDISELAEIARQEPVIMEIAAKKSVELPNVGLVYNYNRALGVGGINGLKTGNNDGNQGALAFTADIRVAGKTIEISGAVMRQASLLDAITSSEALVKSIAQNFESIQLIEKGDVLGKVVTEWGSTTQIVSKYAVNILRWRGSQVSTRYTVHETIGTDIVTLGALEIDAGAIRTSTTLLIDRAALGPSLWWRASRIPHL